MSIGADPRSAAGLYDRKWERFSVNRQGMLMTVGFDLAAPKMRSCKLVDVSQGGASFVVTTTIPADSLSGNVWIFGDFHCWW